MISKALGHYHGANQLDKGGIGEVCSVKDEKLGPTAALGKISRIFLKSAFAGSDNCPLCHLSLGR